MRPYSTGRASYRRGACGPRCRHLDQRPPFSQAQAGDHQGKVGIGALSAAALLATIFRGRGSGLLSSKGRAIHIGFRLVPGRQMVPQAQAAPAPYSAHAAGRVAAAIWIPTSACKSASRDGHAFHHGRRPIASAHRMASRIEQVAPASAPCCADHRGLRLTGRMWEHPDGGATRPAAWALSWEAA